MINKTITNISKPETDYANIAGIINETGLRTEHIYLIYDTSGSMRANESAMYESFVSTCESLKKISHEDYNFVIKLVFFDEEVRPFNEEFMSPDQLLELVSFKRNDKKDKTNPFYCYGRTSIGKIIDYMDKEFNRGSVLTKNMAKSDPETLIILVTDYQATDTKDARDNSTERILSNRFYLQASRMLCIFCGEDKNKGEAVKLAGSPDNLIALGNDISAYLEPVLLKSTISLSDPTHIGRTQKKQTPKQISEDIIDTDKTRGESIAELSEEETKKQLREMLGFGQ